MKRCADNEAYSTQNLLSRIYPLIHSASSVRRQILQRSPPFQYAVSRGFHALHTNILRTLCFYSSYVWALMEISSFGSQTRGHI